MSVFQMYDVVVESDDIPDDQKARICKKIGETDKVIRLVLMFPSYIFPSCVLTSLSLSLLWRIQCLVDGADEYLQLLDVASNIMRALNNMPQEFPFGS